MQSQQKRVKWSRGETAEALEERTDTGITMASVELMENCIPDMFGNISRRPGLKPIPLSNSFVQPTSMPWLGFVQANTIEGLPVDINTLDKQIQFIPFYINENDIIIIGINTGTYLRIQNGKIVSQYNDSSIKNGHYDNQAGKWIFPKVSFAQQNNYMIIATDSNVWKVQFVLNNDGVSFTPSVELWKYNAGWYAPNGTQTKQVNNLTLPNLSFSGNFGNYTYTEIDGTTTVYSWTDTGLTYTDFENINNEIPVGSIVQMPNIGCYLRVEGYTVSGANFMFEDITFDGVLNANDPVPSTGTYCKAVPGLVATLEVYRDGARIKTQLVNLGIKRVKNTNATNGVSETTCYYNGSYWGVFTNWANTQATDIKIYVYGSLLTPVANSSATDSIVSVEYGYQSLTPEDWQDTGNYPHPKEIIFHNQRLWAGAWAYSSSEEYPLVIGSQIGRYNDLKNDYNQENEPITLDILTQFQERILHLVDYNGLKIMTDSYEYAYDNNGVVKQSANGSWEFCDPIVFDSLCLYVDSTGLQVKAMQYEFQANIFNSSTINQFAPHDLVWHSTYLASYEDKANSTGKYLFVTNEQINDNSLLGVCNFVPGNQATIWNRWTLPQLSVYFGAQGDIAPGTLVKSSFVHSVINTKSQPIFMMKCAFVEPTFKVVYGFGFVPCYIDFDSNIDLQGTIDATGRFVINTVTNTYNVKYNQTIPNAEIAVYSNGEFQFTTTTDKFGIVAADVSELTNVTAGLMINATIRSHPIDVGGKTKSIKKRIAKARMSVHNTEPGVITINSKTGYMNPAKDLIDFYGVTGMKDEVRYTITNNKGAMFHLESLLMNIEYGTLIS